MAKVRTAIIVDGRLALRQQRVSSARALATGQDVLSLPILAARLAGGFYRPATRQALYRVVQTALSDLTLPTLGESVALPGTARAVVATLQQFWRADLDWSDPSIASNRLADLRRINDHIDQSLPADMLSPQCLRDVALGKVTNIARYFDRIDIGPTVDIDRLWRPLLIAIEAVIPVAWTCAPTVDTSWFSGSLTRTVARRPKSSTAEVCADPRSEVVEALRWARQLAANGVPPSSIAIAAAATNAWDEHMFSLSRHSGLPVAMVSGVPALATEAGVACAALADVLQGGIDQARVRRLFRRGALLRQDLPLGWKACTKRNASIRTIEQWRHALASAEIDGRLTGDEAQQTLELLTILARGTAAASEAGPRFLQAAALELWTNALASAPASAISLALRDLKVDDEREPSSHIVWCTAGTLAAAPRPWVRLLGLSSRHWPRTADVNPLLPDHILPRNRLSPLSLTERDRRLFEIISGAATEQLSLSRPMREDRGSLLSKSSLWPADETVLPRARIPASAYSEADRLLARPKEAVQLDHVRAAQQAWSNWWSKEATPHDGHVRPGHAAINGALGRGQTSTSLERLLRDPMGFLWRDVLGWQPLRLEPDPLELDPASFGGLVHSIIAHTIDLGSAGRRFSETSTAERLELLTAASDRYERDWPLSNTTPPQLLWREILNLAQAAAGRAILEQPELTPGSQSFSEVVFGVPDVLPLAPLAHVAGAVPIEGTMLRFTGRIDRIDLDTNDALIVTDYKTGKGPGTSAKVLFAQGRELQRVLYSIAAAALYPPARRVTAQLVYIGDDRGVVSPLDADAVADAIVEIAKYLQAAVDTLQQGRVPLRTKIEDMADDLRLAYPADFEGYVRNKSEALRDASSSLAKLWRAK